MKSLNLFLLLFFINLNINAQNCVYLREECGGPIFLEGMSLCITYTCYGPGGGVPQTSTVCRTIYEGTACGYPSQGIDCVLSFRIPGLYASVTGSLNGTVTVKRWLAPSILLDGNNLDSRIVFYEPDPADSYYNYSSTPLSVCKENTNSIDFKGHIMPGNCVNYKLYRSTSTHPGAPTGPLLASMNGLTYNPIQNIDALLDGPNIPKCIPLILVIESYCCGGTPTNLINKTKYIFLKVVENTNVDFQFTTSSLGDQLVNSPEETNQSDNLENIGGNIVLSPYACGAYFPAYNTNQCITEIKYDLEYSTDCVIFNPLYTSGWIPRNSTGSLPAQVNFNAIPINGAGGYFATGYPANIGNCYKFIMSAKSVCGIQVIEGIFSFSQAVYYLKKETEKYSEAIALSNFSNESEMASEAIELYPNPAGQHVLFTNSDIISKVNVLSSQLKFHDITLIEGGIDISQLSTGLWYCELILKDGSKIYKKLIKN